MSFSFLSLSVRCLVPHSSYTEDDDSTSRNVKAEACKDTSPNGLDPDSDLDYKVDWYREQEFLMSSSMRYYFLISVAFEKPAGLFPK